MIEMLQKKPSKGKKRQTGTRRNKEKKQIYLALGTAYWKGHHRLSPLPIIQVTFVGDHLQIGDSEESLSWRLQAQSFQLKGGK